MSLTLAEVDEALTHLRAVPAEERGPAWHAYCDSLLEERARIEQAALAPTFSN